MFFHMPPAYVVKFNCFIKPQNKCCLLLCRRQAEHRQRNTFMLLPALSLPAKELKHVGGNPRRQKQLHTAKKETEISDSMKAGGSGVKETFNNSSKGNFNFCVYLIEKYFEHCNIRGRLERPFCTLAYPLCSMKRF